MKAKQRVALIGSGFIGQVHAANLALHPSIELVAVSDIDLNRAQDLSSRFGGKVMPVEEAVSHNNVDMVLIASATPSHAELLDAATLAGKSVYCEKPIDLSLERARNIVKKVAPRGLPVTVGFNRRFDASHQQMKAQVTSGKLGKPEVIQMICRTSAMPPISYLRDSGGQMKDQAIHFFDLLRWLTSDEVDVVGALGGALVLPEIADFNDTDTSVLIMRMRNGTLVQLDTARRTTYGYDERMSVMGEGGLADSSAQSPQGVTVFRGNEILRPGLWPDWFSRMKDTYYQHLDAFVRQLNGEKVEGMPGLIDGLQAQAIAESATQSLRTGSFCKVEIERI